MLLIKDKVLEFVKCIDMDTEGQIWVILSFLVTYKLGGVYIPPDNSPYFQAADIGALAAHTLDSNNMFVLGDLNARVAVPALVDPEGMAYVYTGVADQTLNARGRSILNVCANNDMVVANHLNYMNKQLGGNLSYKQRQLWISELDLCLAKQTCIDQIAKVDIRQDIKGSDHAPLCVTLAIPSATITNIESLMKRSAVLGQRQERPKAGYTLRKSASFKNTNLQDLKRLLENTAPPAIPPVLNSADQLSNIVETGCCAIMDSAARCIKSDATQERRWDQVHSRWHKYGKRKTRRLY